jgi:amino acid adenylation domain-containing protein
MDKNFSKQLDAAASQYTKEKEYWLSRLAGELETVGFQPDYSPVSEGRKPAAVSVELPEEIVLELIKLGNNSELRLYIAVTAGLIALLYKYTDRDDIIIGAPIFKQAVEGQLVNTVLTLRHSIPRDISFRQLLMQVSRTLYEANENQNYPIETLLYKLDIPYSRDADFPLFDAAVLLENLHERRYLDRVHLKMIFSFGWERQENRIRVKVEYDARLYREESVKRIMKHFIVLLEAIFCNMDLELGRVDIVPEEEKKQLLEEFNATDSAYPYDKPLHRLFAEQAAGTPDIAAVVGNKNKSGETVQLTYRELNRNSDQLAHVLKEKGILAGDIAGIMDERSVEMIIGLLGILKSGAAYLPIDPRYPGNRVRFMLADSAAKILLTSGDNIPLPPEDDIAIHNPQQTFATGSSLSQPEASLENLRHASQASASLAYVIYTSGTTGNPKAVMIEHRNAVNTVSWFARQYRVGVGTHVLQTTDSTFDPSMEQIFGTLLHGASLYLISREMLGDLYRMRRFIAENQVHVINFVPMLLKELLGAGPVLGSLRAVISGGDRLEEETKNVIIEKGYELFNHYGPTEITVDALAAKCSRKDAVTLGKPISNVRCYIVDPTGLLSPVGVVGELLVGGGGVARGYLNNPELTAEKFNHKKKNRRFLGGPGGRFFKKAPLAAGGKLYKTGDLARWLGSGHIEFLGRIDHQIKIRGYRVELGEIESQLRKHPLVSDVVVAAFGETSRYLCAYMVLKASAASGSFSPGEMREYLARKLPSYMVPSYFIEIERIPLTFNGKINRKALPLVDTGVGAVEYAAPRNEIEEKLAALWSEVLEVDPGVIGIDINFFESGGHSLNATVLVAKMHKELNVKVPMVELFRAPTIRELSRYIEGAVKDRHLSLENVEKKEYYPLSSAQERLYILQSMDGTGISYNLPAVLELKGNVDKERIEGVFLRLIGRHESFRTSFEMAAGEPVQKVHENVEFKIENCDVPDPAKHIIDNFVRPFDLSRVPLIRLGLLRTGEAKHMMMLDMHHIITDGISMGIVIREFSTLYASQGDRSLPGLRLQYKDYSEWQRKIQSRREESESLDTRKGFWLKQFEGEIPILGLPTDFARPAIQSFKGDRRSFRIGKEETAGLKTAADRVGATFYQVLLAIYNVFLSRISGQEDIIIGTPVAGRRHVDFSNIVGMFVNTLPLRNFPGGGKTFQEFLKELKQRTLDAFENQEYPFEELVENVPVPRDIGRNPLFDTLFSFENMDILKAEIPGLMVAPCEYKTGTSKFDLTLIVDENEKENPVFTFEYCTELFKRESIERFINYFKRIISSLVSDFHREISQIEMTADEEKKQVLHDFNDTGAEYPAGKTIHECFEEQAARTPDGAAVIGSKTISGETVQLTYTELNKKSGRLAHLLRENGVLADNIVGMMVERSIEMIVGILGILKAGGAYMPIDPGFPEGRIDYMLTDSGARLLLAAPGARVKGREIEIIDISKKLFSSTLTCQVSPVNLAYVIYTSGTTGNPKGVLIQHYSLINFIYSMYRNYGNHFGPPDRCLCLTNCCFDVSVCEIFMPLVFGSGIVVLHYDKIFAPGELAAVIVEQSITFTYIPPALLSDVCENLASRRALLMLDKMLVGVEPIKDRVLEGYMKLNPSMRIVNGYGPTEATICATAYRYYSHEPQDRRVPIGGPLSNTHVLLLDKYDHPVPVGVPGELCIAGHGLTRGYLNQPELTAEKLDQDYRDKKKKENYQKFFGGSRGAILQKSPPGRRRLYRTGDRAKWLQDGNIEFLGRMDHQVKIRGFRIELGEIENRLLKHKNIKEAVVIDRIGSTGEKYLCAYIVAHSPGPLALRQYLSRTLPGYMIPSYFVQIEDMPLTPNGKVDRKTLPEPGARPVSDYVAPATDNERKIAEIWKKTLGLEKVGIHDNFFDVGGNSLKIVKLSVELKNRMGKEIPVAKMFQYPTIASLAGYIGEGDRIEIRRVEEKKREEAVEVESIKSRLRQRRKRNRS